MCNSDVHVELYKKKTFESQGDYATTWCEFAWNEANDEGVGVEWKQK